MVNKSQKPKVIVCGAGIGGLTVAHELAKRNVEVVVYEKNNIVGGMARSNYHINKKTGKKYPTEYSWRVYGSEYKNLLRLLHEIPLHKKKKKSVFNNLLRVRAYILPRFNRDEVILSLGKYGGKLSEDMSTYDLLKILDKILYCVTMSTRRMDSLDHVTWKDFCKDLSPEAKKYTVQIWGPLLGMDTTHMSFPVIARLAGVLIVSYFGFASPLYLLNRPTNDGWFDEWVDYLRATKNVTIKTNCEILDITMKEGEISTIKIRDHKKDKTYKESADYYVCGLPVEAIAKIVSKNPVLSKIPSLKNTILLAKRCKQIQLSVQIFLDKKIKYPTKGKSVIYLPDTPWSLIIEPQDIIWGRTFCTDKRVKTVLSVGICQTDCPGILYNKPFTACTKDEIQNEVWNQIKKSYHHSRIVTEDKKKIDTAQIVLFYMWDSFKCKKGKHIETSEPTFSNNAHSLRYQPRHATEIPNFLFATGYTKTDRYIFSMEAAAEAGTACANEIITRYNKKNNTSMPLTHIHPFSVSIILLKPLMYMDAILFRLGLPHLSKVMFNNSIILIFLYLGILLLAVVGLVVLFL